MGHDASANSHTLNRNPCAATSPDAALTAPSTNSPLSSLRFNPTGAVGRPQRPRAQAGLLARVPAAQVAQAPGEVGGLDEAEEEADGEEARVVAARRRGGRYDASDDHLARVLSSQLFLSQLLYGPKSGGMS
ncbi:hypothetical protein CTA1_3451 [Colletotrichum tanaceti]|uniref:Uncharacterized protein n=1 Tax=Colletotrichum tanaceti TaxID=1306861 RepID=A0A4U6X653_9PEZI|nr:hypothetical protein CTA1_3451 [Colletotrichum tanaceti]